MKDKIFGVLQRVGRSFMLPIAMLTIMSKVGSAVIAYFVMNTAINAMLTLNGKILDDGSIAKDVLEGTITSVCGIQSLQMGVFGGILMYFI